MANFLRSHALPPCTLVLLAATSLTPRATLAQSPEQMEYERQQREYWQAQEQQRQEQQRMLEENARRQQEEAMSAAQPQYDAPYEVQSQSAPCMPTAAECRRTWCGRTSCSPKPGRGAAETSCARSRRCAGSRAEVRMT
jgi:hypothetical protein